MNLRLGEFEYCKQHGEEMDEKCLYCRLPILRTPIDQLPRRLVCEHGSRRMDCGDCEGELETTRLKRKLAEVTAERKCNARLDVFPTVADDLKSDIKYVDWMYPKVGTCGQQMDILGIELCRVMSVPTICLRFDANRSVWSIGKMVDVVNPDPTKLSEEIRFQEVATVAAELLETEEDLG